MPANAGSTVQKILLYLTVEKQWLLFMHICDTKPNCTEKKNIMYYMRQHKQLWDGIKITLIRNN
jgi:hypothetical protein